MFDSVRRMRGASKHNSRQERTNTEISEQLLQTWKDYSYTVGDDIELKEARDAKKMHKKDKLWFVKKGEKMLKKVFVSFKVKRVSDIDNVKEQFRIKFHLYFNWLPTYEEYSAYLEHKENNNLLKWEPQWFPHLEFMNQIDTIKPFPKWEEYPDEGRFRMQKFKKFFGGGKWCDDKKSKFDPNKAYFIRAKYDVEMVLSEELELQAFPFDCQDLSVIIRENSQDVKCVFLPELRKPKFGSVDPRYSVIDEWDMEAARIEFGTTNAGASRSSSKYPMIILRLKMKRRWGVYMWNVVFLMMCIESLGLCCFALDIQDDSGERLGLAMTLVLTAVAFLHVVKGNLPSVPYLTFLDKYVLSGYLFLIFIMIETAFVARGIVDFQDDWDLRFMALCSTYLVIYHFVFAWYAVKIRQDELDKLVMDSDEIEQEVNLTRSALKFDYRKGARDGIGNRLLVFRAEKVKPKQKDAKKDEKSGKKDDKVTTRIDSMQTQHSLQTQTRDESSKAKTEKEKDNGPPKNFNYSENKENNKAFAE